MLAYEAKLQRDPVFSVQLLFAASTEAERQRAVAKPVRAVSQHVMRLVLAIPDALALLPAGPANECSPGPGGAPQSLNGIDAEWKSTGSARAADSGQPLHRAPS